MTKQPNITNKMQEVAVDILSELEMYMMTHNEVPEEINRIFDKMYKKYQLCKDPFTLTVCTIKEWAKNSLEYDRQTMIEQYGHCDGLD